MKKLIALLALTSLSAGPALAQEAWRHSLADPGDIYFGLGATQIDIDNIDREPANMTAFLGVTLTDNQYGSLYVDSSYSRTIIQEGRLGDNEFDMNLVTAFLAYRTPTRVYLKAKAGLVYSSTELSSNGVPDKIDSSAEFQPGVGLGIEIYPGINLEAEMFEVQDAATAIQASIIFN
ncbi:MAG: outer membrane beta-barrel protein [Pseudomonadota bacterium]|jgi:hypothetical protein